MAPDVFLGLEHLPSQLALTTLRQPGRLPERNRAFLCHISSVLAGMRCSWPQALGI